MKGMVLGPYRIERELGSGGMGTVHLAEVLEPTAGLEPGRHVALKVVHPHLLSQPSCYQRFRREAELGRKVIHPNVVRTFAVDTFEVGDREFNVLAMEYVEGKNLRQLLEELGTLPESLLREIAAQIAAGLAAIHRVNIVHRDLKPENVLITDDRRVRIMDLGVAKFQDATAPITCEGQFAGSLLYAAPEQFAGLDVGPSVDLYALGVLLYELATGKNPFRREGGAAMIAAQLMHHPPRLAEGESNVTDFFSELVATLLAKTPAERFESAKTLEKILEQGEQSRWWTMLEPRLEHKALPKIRVQRRTRCHGREASLATLTEAWKQAQAGEGNTILVEGEAGIGKTRLIDAFLREAEDPDVHILYGAYAPSGGLGGLSDTILGKFGEVDLAASMAPYLMAMPRLVPTFAARVKRENPPPGAAPLTGDGLSALFVQLMRSLAAEKKLIWVVEDLHFAPKESRDIVLSMARAAGGHRVLVIATTRPSLPAPEIANLGRLPNFQRLRLDRLGPDKVGALLEDAFQDESLAAKLGATIAKKSDGIPFFIFELIRELESTQVIRRQEDGRYVQMKALGEIEVPSAIKGLIDGRLEALDEEQRSILDVGAVVGLVFDPGLVAAVLDETRVHVLRQLAEIQRRHGLVLDERDRLRFDHNQIQEVLYQDLPAPLCAEVHALVAEAYARQLEGEPAGEDAVFLATHHLLGSRSDAGRPYLWPALTHLETSFRNEAVIRLATRALQAPRLLADPERIEVLLHKAARHDLCGEREQARTDLDEAMKLVDAMGDKALCARVRSTLVEHLVRIADLPLARKLQGEALVLAREAGDPATVARATGNLGNVFLCEGRIEEARAQFEQHLALARELEDRPSEAVATGNLGLACLSQARYEDARAHFEKDLALTRELGNRQGEANAVGNLGLVCAGQGRMEEARAQFEEQLALSRKIGDRQAEALAIGNLASVLRSQGRYEEARRACEQHLVLAREIGDRYGEALIVGCLGNIMMCQGLNTEAQEHYHVHRAISREIGDRYGEALTSGNLCLVFSKEGRHAEAHAQCERFLLLARALGDPRLEGYALSARGTLAEAQDDAEAALGHFEDALQLRRELGEKDALARSLVARCGIALARGETEFALSQVEEALELAREVREPGPLLLASIYRARLPGGDATAALEALEKHEAYVDHTTKMRAHFHLFKLTGERVYLEKAHRLLENACAHTLEKHRKTMLENVRLHRDIEAAWQNV